MKRILMPLGVAVVALAVVFLIASLAGIARANPPAPLPERVMYFSYMNGSECTSYGYAMECTEPNGPENRLLVYVVYNDGTECANLGYAWDCAPPELLYAGFEPVGVEVKPNTDDWYECEASSNDGWCQVGSVQQGIEHAPTGAMSTGTLDGKPVTIRKDPDGVWRYNPPSPPPAPTPPTPRSISAGMKSA